MRDPAVVINFGKYKGLSVSDQAIPTTYILWLAGMPSLKSPTNSFETVWTCPGKVWAAAMKEADKRGYKPEGDGWIEKDDTVYGD